MLTESCIFKRTTQFSRSAGMELRKLNEQEKLKEWGCKLVFDFERSPFYDPKTAMGLLRGIPDFARCSSCGRATGSTVHGGTWAFGSKNDFPFLLNCAFR